MTNSPELHSGKQTLTLAVQALSQAAERMGDDFDNAVSMLAKSAGKIVVTGVGKSAHIAAKIAATLNSTGSSDMFLHAGEALHGYLGAVGWMKTHSISQVVVMDGEHYAGMVHLHDCLREGLG